VTPDKWKRRAAWPKDKLEFKFFFNPALNIFLYSYLKAEARLAAKRAARAEARSIRLKELERQQQEGENVCLSSHIFLLLQQVDICTFIVYFKLILGVYQDKPPILHVFLLVKIARQSDCT